MSHWEAELGPSSFQGGAGLHVPLVPEELTTVSSVDCAVRLTAVGRP